MPFVVAANEKTHILVPILLTVYGVWFWSRFLPRYLRDPRGEIWRTAEGRARGIWPGRRRLDVKPEDVEREFANQWRLRWAIPVGFVTYFTVTALAFRDALQG